MPNSCPSSVKTSEHEALASILINDSYAPVTLANYSRWIRRFAQFATSRGLQHLPASSDTVESFILFCYQNYYSVGTIRSALGAISFHHKCRQYKDPTRSFRITRLLIGIKKNAKVKDKLLPINHKLLEKILIMSDNIASNYKKWMFKAMLLLLYHGCMRVCEIVKSPSNDHALKFKDLSIIHKNIEPRALKLTLATFKHSKESVSFKIRKQDNANFCPVQVLLQYVKLRGHKDGPLFINENGKPANRQFLASHLKSFVKKLGLTPSSYNTHSLRIGRTTDMAAAGVPEQIIKATGRWGSDAFTKYIRFDNFTVPRV